MKASEAFTALGLPPTAAVDDVKRAYRQCAATTHPDKGGDAAAFQELSAAYEVALKVAERPVHCPACEGLGKVAVAKAGFAAVERRCNACHGAGRVERGSKAPIPLLDVLKAEERGFNVKQVRAVVGSFEAWRRATGLAVQTSITVEDLQTWLSTLEAQS